MKICKYNVRISYIFRRAGMAQYEIEHHAPQAAANHGLWRQVFYLIEMVISPRKVYSDHMGVCHVAIPSFQTKCIVLLERLDRSSAHPRYREYSGLFVAPMHVRTANIRDTADR